MHWEEEHCKKVGFGGEIKEFDLGEAEHEITLRYSSGDFKYPDGHMDCNQKYLG